jgi:hypothetical protein
MLDRDTLFLLVIGVCIANGILSPYLSIAIPVTNALMPELFPRTVGWVLFWSSVLVSSVTLLVSGVPAALYERRAKRAPDDTVSMWIWLGGAAALSLPAVVRVL